MLAGRTERENVRARVWVAPFELFGSPVLQRAEDRALCRETRRRG
jgi:hypothetical protein